MANEPRSYREAIAKALGSLRPGAEVVVVEPEAVEDELLRQPPDMVVCSEATAAVRERVPVWVELHPNHRAFSVVSVEGERSTVPDMQFSDLLSILDRAGEIAHLSQG